MKGYFLLLLVCITIANMHARKPMSAPRLPPRRLREHYQRRVYDTLRSYNETITLSMRHKALRTTRITYHSLRNKVTPVPRYRKKNYDKRSQLNLKKRSPRRHTRIMLKKFRHPITISSLRRPIRRSFKYGITQSMRFLVRNDSLSNLQYRLRRRKNIPQLRSGVTRSIHRSVKILKRNRVTDSLQNRMKMKFRVTFSYTIRNARARLHYRRQDYGDAYGDIGGQAPPPKAAPNSKNMVKNQKLDPALMSDINDHKDLFTDADGNMKVDLSGDMNTLNMKSLKAIEAQAFSTPKMEQGLKTTPRQDYDDAYGDNEGQAPPPKAAPNSKNKVKNQKLDPALMSDINANKDLFTDADGNMKVDLSGDMNTLNMKSLEAIEAQAFNTSTMEHGLKTTPRVLNGSLAPGQLDLNATTMQEFSKFFTKTQKGGPQVTIDDIFKKYSVTTTTTRRITKTTVPRWSFKENCRYIAKYCLMSAITGPVCARTHYYHHYTFPNVCMMEYVNCMARFEVWRMTHMFPCYTVDYQRLLHYTDIVPQDKYMDLLTTYQNEYTLTDWTLGMALLG